jgi:dienelactone hydrolase
MFLASSNQLMAQLKLQFPAKDGLLVTADWYPVNSDNPVVLLCHQAGYSRGEYNETAVKLNTFGFNCLAVDQRSGKEINGVINETAQRAEKEHKKTSYLDAEKDIVAAMEYLYDKYHKRVILVGSSYSASLVMKIANENEHAFAAVAFSPGEYFQEKDCITKSIKGFTKPLFTTSSKEEAEGVTELVKDVNALIKVQYIPKTAGDHGSKVLWNSSPDHEAFWIALMSFLDRMKREQ